MAESKQRRKKVIVIGTGVGGTATAARLAKAGMDVTVVEKNDYSGGRCSLLHKDGFRFDQGPSFYLMPEVFEELFQDLGTHPSEHYELVKCDPNYIIHFHDNDVVTLSTDMSLMRGEIERYEGKDGWERFLRFMKEGHIHYETSVKEVLHNNFPTFASLVRLKYLAMALKLHVLDRLYRRASNYFWTDRLRRAFTFSSMYLGMSPFKAPATYNLLQYTELAQGIWYPIGGFHKVISSLESIATKYGATFRYNTPVSRIRLSPDGTKATGVVLSDGEELEADQVVCNADLVWAYNNLLPSTRYSRNLAKNSKLTCSSISFYWGLSRKVDSKTLSTHNIFLAEDFEGSFDKIFDHHSLPDEPSFYVNVPSKVDPSASPEGKETLVVLIPVGHLVDDSEEGRINVETKSEKAGTAAGSQSANGSTSGKKSSSQDWTYLVERARSHVIRTLSSQLKIPEFESLIETEMVNTPVTWRDNLNLHMGSILGLSHDILQVLYFRPRIRHDSIKGLYFVGASTHPGTGVPICICGSKLTSEEVLKDARLSVPWPSSSSSSQPSQPSSIPSQRPSGKPQTTVGGGMKVDLDAIHPPRTLFLEWFITSFAVPALFGLSVGVVLVLALLIVAFNDRLDGGLHPGAFGVY